MSPEFVALASAAVRGEPLTDELQSYVRESIREWVSLGGSLDAAFGLARGVPGERSSQSRLTKVLRDGRIRDASLQLGQISHRSAAREIARRLAYLGRGGSPKDAVDRFLEIPAKLGPLGEESVRKILTG